jgi:hypothetical protein
MGNYAHALTAKTMYDSGLRLMECVRLRIKDIHLFYPDSLDHKLLNLDCADLELGNFCDGVKGR